MDLPGQDGSRERPYWVSADSRRRRRRLDSPPAWGQGQEQAARLEREQACWEAEPEPPSCCQ